MKNIRGDIPRKHIKSINKMKPSYKNILSHIQKSTASNSDLEVIEKTISDMVAKKSLTNEWILNESCNWFTLPQFLDDEVKTLCLEKGNQSLQKLAHELIDNLETILLASLQGIPEPIKFYCQSLILSKQIWWL